MPYIQPTPQKVFTSCLSVWFVSVWLAMLSPGLQQKKKLHMRLSACTIRYSTLYNVLHNVHCVQSVHSAHYLQFTFGKVDSLHMAVYVARQALLSLSIAQVGYLPIYIYIYMCVCVYLVSPTSLTTVNYDILSLHYIITYASG